MIVALIDSGFGLLPTAAHLAELRPDLDQLLMMDPDGAPWGPKPRQWTVDTVVATAQRAVALGAEVIVLPCNTASVTALEHARAAVGASVPVVGTVPAVKPAAAQCDSFAVWATATTTASRYQADLINEFASARRVAAVACLGLAEAIDRGDDDAVATSIADAAARTPEDATGVVLGCTHYPLVHDVIAGALPPNVTLFDSAPAVAAQTVRRVDEVAPARATAGAGSVSVILSGRPGTLPPGAQRYAAGRLLASRVVAAPVA